MELASRKTRDRLLAVKKELSDYKLKDFGFNDSEFESKRVFLNESLTRKRKELLRKVKDRKADFGFKYVWTSKGNIFVRMTEKSPAKRINQLDDLNKLNE